MSGKIKVRRGLLKSLGWLEANRRHWGDGTIPFYETTKLVDMHTLSVQQ